MFKVIALVLFIHMARDVITRQNECVCTILLVLQLMIIFNLDEFVSYFID